MRAPHLLNVLMGQLWVSLDDLSSPLFHVLPCQGVPQVRWSTFGYFGTFHKISNIFVKNGHRGLIFSVSVPLVVLSIIFIIFGVRKAVLVKSWASLGMGQNFPLRLSISDNYKCSSRFTRPNWMKTYSLPQKNVAQLMVMVSGLKNVGVGNQKLFCVRCP